MRWQIYCIFMFVCVVSSLCKPMNEDIADSYIAKMLNYCTILELSAEQQKKRDKIEIREAVFKLNNVISIPEISNDEGYTIPEELNPIIQQIFPDSTQIYFIKDVLEKLDAIKDKKTTNIIKKLKKYNGNEYITLKNLVQILTDEYIEIPFIMVGFFNNFLKRFHSLDTSKTGFISKDNFSSVIEAVIKNRDTIEHVLKPLEDVENLYYEAWLLNKREVVYDMIHSRNNKIDEGESSNAMNNEVLLDDLCYIDEFDTDEDE